MTTGRPFRREDYLAMKSAVRRACEDAGPLHTIAEHTRVDPARLSLYGNPARPEFIPLDVAMDLDALSGGDRILRAWAEARGYELHREERGVAVEDMHRHVGAVGKETGELISTMCTAVADGRVTPHEAAHIEDEADQAIDNIRLLKEDMRRLRAAG